MNKLKKLLASLAGQELTAAHIKEVNTLIEGVTVKLDAKDAEITKLGDELKPFKDEATKAAELKAFTDAGGHESKFEDFKDAGGNAENAAEKIAKFASLKAEAAPKYNGTNGGQFQKGEGVDAGNSVDAGDELEVS